MMRVKAFVDGVEAFLQKERGVFQRVCGMAARGKMGFGTIPEDWGSKDRKKG